jgi:hypothetical protein
METRKGRLIVQHPDFERMSQPIHVHLQPGLTEGDR